MTTDKRLVNEVFEQYCCSLEEYQALFEPVDATEVILRPDKSADIRYLSATPKSILVGNRKYVPNSEVTQTLIFIKDDIKMRVGHHFTGIRGTYRSTTDVVAYAKLAMCGSRCSLTALQVFAENIFIPRSLVTTITDWRIWKPFTREYTFQVDSSIDIVPRPVNDEIDIVLDNNKINWL